MKIFTRRSYEKKRASSDVMPTMTRNDEEGRKKVAEESRVKHCLTQHLLYINIREQKTLQTLHKTLHSFHISLILRALQCVGFEAKILHKPCTEPYMGTKSQRDKESKRRSLPQPLPKGKGFVAALMHRTWGSFLGESKRRREGEWERGRERKTMGRERKTRGRLVKTMGRQRKI